MSTLISPVGISWADAHVVATATGVVSCAYLHKSPMRGDVALVLGLTTACALYAVRRVSASASTSVLFAATMLVYHLGTIALATISYRLSPFHPLARFPGPLINKMTSLKLAHMVWTGKRHLVIHGLHEKYGKVVRTGPNTLSFNSHTAVAPIYASASAWDKSTAYIPGKIHGSGLFFMQPVPEHNVRRRHWAPAFAPQVVADYKPAVEQRTDELMECMAMRRKGPHGAINLSEAIQHWSYDVMGSLTFGGSNRLELMKDNDVGRYVESGQVATVAFETLGEVPSLFDLVWYLPLTKVIRVLDDLAGTLIIARQKNNHNRNDDIASYLLGEHDQDGPKLSPDDLRMDALFAIQAGSDTTSGVLTFVFYYLLTEKAVYDRLQTELDDAFPDREGPLSLDLLTTLPYLNAVVDESLRLGTPFPGLPRVSPKGGVVIDDVFIPGGTIVGVPAYAQEISPENFWPEPLGFKPERWLPEGLGPGSRARKSAIMSFSSGPFGCLGKSLAIQELRLVTAKMMLTYDMKLAPNFDRAQFEKGITNMRTTIFEYPLQVVAERRQ